MSTHKVDNIQESTPAAGVTVQGLKAPGFKASLPVFANAAARDALYPVPQLNDQGIQQDIGYHVRYDGAAWRPEGISRTAGPVISTIAMPGFVGDGVNDDGVALAAADAKAVASGGRQELDLSTVPTRCHINSDRTLTGHFRPNPGTKRIWVTATHTLTILGHFDPGLYQIFDPAMPGNVKFVSGAGVGNRTIRRYQVAWWCVGDKVADDSVGFSKLLASIPPRSTVEAPHQFHMKWNSTPTWIDGFSVHFYSDVMPFDSTGDEPDMGPKIVWGGAVHASAMLVMNGCGYCEFFGWNFQATPLWGDATLGADCCIDIRQDRPPATRISTMCKFFQCCFWGGAGNDAWYGVKNSTPATDNNEYHSFVRCVFRGMNGFQGSYGYLVGSRITISLVDPTLVTMEGAFVQAGWVGQTVDIADANGGPVLGGDLVTTVASYVSATQFRLTAPATTAVTLGRMTLGKANGIGYIQSGQNAHFTKFEWCFFSSLFVGISLTSGSAHMEYCGFNANEIDIFINGFCSMPSSESWSNCETSRQHLVYQPGLPYTMWMCRFAFDQKKPNAGWIEFQGASTGWKMENTNFDQLPRAGEAYFTFTNGPSLGARLLLERNYYAGLVATDTSLFGPSGAPTNTNGAILQWMDAAADIQGDGSFGALFRIYAPNNAARFDKTNLITRLITNIPTPTTDLGPQDFVMQSDSGGGGPPMYALHKNAFSVMQKLGLRVDDKVQVTGVAFQPDLGKYKFFIYEMTGAAPAVSSSLGGAVGDEFDVVFWNHSGGAVVTNWHGTWVFPTGAPWVEPANNTFYITKWRRFSAGGGNFQYCTRVAGPFAGAPG